MTDGGGRRAPSLMDYTRASELGYCRAICSGALLYGSPFNANRTLVVELIIKYSEVLIKIDIDLVEEVPSFDWFDANFGLLCCFFGKLNLIITWKR